MTRRPNLLFIMSDQHAQRIAGCYGDSVVETPNIDRLAKSGVVFDNAYCPSPICLPARMSALSARYPVRQNCWTNTDYLASDIPTMAHALGAGGYRPVLVGRMHALGPDQLHGYVRREVGDHSPNWAGIPRHDMGPLANTNDPYRVSLERSGEGQSAYERKDVDVTAAAIAALEEVAARRAKGDAEPFALTVGYMLPHPPYVARAQDYRRYEGRVPLPAIPAPSPEVEHPWIAWWRDNRDIREVSPEDALRARTAYYALTSRLDGMVGEILARLDELGLRDDTLIVYTSDHGDHVGDRGLWWKHTLYDESVKVPLVLSWPGRLPQNERRSAVVNLIDLAPTVLEALGAPALPNADGRSFLAVARDAGAPWIDETFAEYCTDAAPAWTGGQATRHRMIRSGHYKLNYYDGMAPQLFDLDEDPLEQNDLAASPAHTSVRHALLGRLLADWDPVEIDRIMTRRVQDKELLAGWARSVGPRSEHLWEMRPEDNYLGLAGDEEE
ncbi:sulfatase-like hydrolase/transferase [Geminicoccus roseus]|uniref:sulfatase-like hydrolase/transferase n=1 Tax=Geminicoccus roseus TaxID=404900 RepID=UPI0003FC271F|nr:sulfatase-like hydrolase/transferase [Geminicoccus roseus]